MSVKEKPIEDVMTRLEVESFHPLDIFPHESLCEKIVELEVKGIPSGIHPKFVRKFSELLGSIRNCSTDKLRVVIFGGGTGLSTIIGGDSRSKNWPNSPFQGLKEMFPNTQSVVCISDDGGSTGELLKDLPLIGIGDIRHVLLSAIQKSRIQAKYSLTEKQVTRSIKILHSFFNFRIARPLPSLEELLGEEELAVEGLPDSLREKLLQHINRLFTDEYLKPLLSRNHCLGNLIIVSAIFEQLRNEGWKEDNDIPQQSILSALDRLGLLIGTSGRAVLPCTTTPACLQILYTNGVLVTGEYKSGYAARNSPVDRVFVKFVECPQVPKNALTAIRDADIIIYAPGSLYSSIIPIFQTPGIADEVRRNQRALKLFIANLWVQKGETDGVSEDPARQFHTSDLLNAYHKNIQGGIHNLFNLILTLDLKGIPGSILQKYAVENKIPIYLDRKKVEQMGFLPIEAGIYCEQTLHERQVIKHDPEIMAKVIRCIYALRDHIECGTTGYFRTLEENEKPLSICERWQSQKRFQKLGRRLNDLVFDGTIKKEEIYAPIENIIWKHPDIQLNHLSYFKGITFIGHSAWTRCQKWDNIFSFYDPNDRFIKIRSDEAQDPSKLELALLVAMGQALLGNYIESKELEDLDIKGAQLGSIYRIILRPETSIDSFLSFPELDQYLRLARMIPVRENDRVYSRVVNGNEGFTPPGLLFGLIYAWYLDNRLASHVEYKMAILRNEISDLVPEQVRVFRRRQKMIKFFREVVFGHRWNQES